MVKPAQRLVLVLFIAVLCVAVLVIWLSAPDNPEVQARADLNVGSDAGQEPITTIPIALNLDARKVALGRRLFYDPLFSRDNKVACVHCHNLATGGVDGLQHARVAGGSGGKINTLTVFNSGYNFKLFWDGRAATLEDQIEFPVPHASEMDSTWPEIIARLESDTVYRRDFLAIYQEGIEAQSVKNAIATFERSLTTPDSRFDLYLRGDTHALDSDELAGYELFKNLGCISCHQGRNVGGNMYEKLGLVENFFENRGLVQEVDFGRYNVTGKETDRFEFRVPSLRNVALTAPYFHDASAATLEHAVATMAKYQLGIDLNGDEIAKIVKFLNTLTGVYKGEQGK